MKLFYTFFVVILFAFPSFAQINSELLASAEKGNAATQYIVGVAYHGGMGGVNQDYKKAAEWLSKSANQDFADAQAMLGTMYFKGQGVVKDDKKAIEWITKAANQGQPEAQVTLGSAYYDGKVVGQSHNKAAEWYLKAANQGNTLAQAYLGEMYIRGHGVSEDVIRGCAWIHLSENVRLNNICAQGLGQAQKARMLELTYELKRNIRVVR